ncbi:hypothetical protein X943_003257, partial [Babesia divergens]
MFFIPSCCSGWLRIVVSLSVPRTLRSVLIGSLEPLGRIMVCCMYYTDVFVGQVNNIVNLKKALEAELEGSGLTDELNALDQLKALASGLGFLAGLPACLCKTKKSVKEGLQKIYEELKNFNYCISKLNCDSCNSNLYPCKCCVIQSIKAVKKCQCIKTPSNKSQCHCNGKDVSCDRVLAGLEACLHLQCLQSDMNEICKCKADSDCCKNGTCNGTSPSCTFCQKLKSQPTTGLGLSPPNPIRLAKRLEKFFGQGSKSCGCKGSPCSCCCLACPDQTCSSQHCSCKGSPGKCPCTKKPSQCPRKKFCKAINSIKVSSGSSDMTCCNKGNECHCGLDPQNCQPGNCCVVSDSKGSQQGVKCMIRRLVKFFNGLPLDPSSSKNCSKLCCEIFCVLKCCVFLRDFYNRGNKNVCWTCKSGGTKGKCKGSTLQSQPSSKECCGGNISNCASNPNCCQGCQDCDAIKFSRALQKLQYSGPCGQDLYRLLKDLLNFCSNVMHPNQNFIRSTVLKAVKDCSNCKKSETDSSGWKACQCSGSSSCLACTSLLGDSKLMFILRHGYSSAYSSKAKWDRLCSPGSPCSGCRDSPPRCPCKSAFPLPSTSCNGSCCPNCDVKKAAKIFLGMLPCMYWGLKILHDRSKYDSGFAGWHDISVSNDLPSSDLAKFFYAWGYDLRSLKTKKGSEFFSLLDSLSTMKVLEKLSTLVTENYFTSNLISPPKDPKTPSTVRSMLIWLYGLRFQKHFSG